MAWIRCSNGEHVFDDSKHSSCPFCKQKNLSPLPTRANDSTKATKDSSTQQMQIKPGPSAPRTISYWDSKTQTRGFDPVVGWLVSLSKPGLGRDFRLHSGYNVVGRDTNADVLIDFDKSVSSSEHAAIIYDPKTSKFFIEHRKGRNGTYLNENILLSPTQLVSQDKITVGSTTLLFIPLCNDTFNWEAFLKTAGEENSEI